MLSDLMWNWRLNLVHLQPTLSSVVFVSLECLFLKLTPLHSGNKKPAASPSVAPAGVFPDVSLCRTSWWHFFSLQGSRTCTRGRSASVRSCWVSRGRRWWWCATCSPSSTSESPLTQKPLTVNDNRPFLCRSPRAAWFHSCSCSEEG